MTGELFFNGREWRAIGLSEQQVRLVELLLDRTGGAQAPDLNLLEVTNVTIANENRSNRAEHQLEVLKRRIEEIQLTKDHELNILRRRVDSLTEINNAYYAEFKKMQHRINQLEDAQ